jgi:hypothetical protein
MLDWISVDNHTFVCRLNDIRAQQSLPKPDFGELRKLPSTANPFSKARKKGPSHHWLSPFICNELCASPTRYKVHNDRNHSKYQEQVDQKTADVKEGKSAEPEYDEDHREN